MSADEQEPRERHGHHTELKHVQPQHSGIVVAGIAEPDHQRKVEQ